jgi:HD superfamily phosphohydrolase
MVLLVEKPKMSAQNCQKPKLPKELVEAYREAIADRDARIDGLQSRIEELQTDRENLAKELDQLKVRLLTQLPARAKQSASVWLTKKGAASHSTFLHRDDPIYGQLAFHEKLFPLLSHPLFQRLNYVRQLSFAYLTFPSASHTRMSHVLGVAKNAQEAIRKVLTRGVAYRYVRKDPATRIVKVSSDVVRLNVTLEEVERIILKAQLCALLHDIGHGPFGHALDKLVAYNDQVDRTDPPDTVLSLEYIKDHLSVEIGEVGFDADDIMKILDKERKDELTGFDVLIADLIASPIDVDRMDYLVRDAHMTGLEMGYVNTEALLEHMYPIQEGEDYKLVFAPAALCHMEDLAQAHHNMYVQCYEHPRKVATERLLIRAVAYLLDCGLNRDDLLLLTDDQLLTLLSDFLGPETAGGNCLLALRENLHFVQVESYRLSAWSETEQKMVPIPQLSPALKSWYDERAKGKSFLKRVYVESPKSWEDQICRDAGIKKEDRWKVTVSVPAYEAKLPVESGAHVITKGTGGLFLLDFYDASPILRNILKVLMPEREALRVFVTEDIASEIEKVKKAADAIFMQESESAVAPSPTPRGA